MTDFTWLSASSSSSSTASSGSFGAGATSSLPDPVVAAIERVLEEDFLEKLTA